MTFFLDILRYLVGCDGISEIYRRFDAFSGLDMPVLLAFGVGRSLKGLDILVRVKAGSAGAYCHY